MSIDSRIATLIFNNQQFERNANQTLGTLAKLRQSLSFGSIVGGTIRGLGAIDSALGKIGLRTPFSPLIKAANSGLGTIGTVLDKVGAKNPFERSTIGAGEVAKAAQVASGPSGVGALEASVTGVSNKFLVLSTIAITALSNITNKAINAGTSWLKSFSTAPIMDGLNEYQTTLQSIQTVQANTDAPLKQVEDSLQKLNAYSDTTIYNFGQMARNVGTFTAAGVDLKTSVASIQGIANIAALSGSSSEQAATAMYQLSQAISSGKVGLQDWNSVVNAGMGGKKLQNALAQTAIAMGDIDKASVKLVGPMKKLEINGQSFRESIMAQPGQESWLSSDILVNTLASLDGRFSVAYQKAQLLEDGTRKFTDAQIASNMAEARANLEKKNGVKYSDKQYAELLKMADASVMAATQVKTLGQVFDIAKETIGSGWSASFKSIFGGLDAAKKTFTGMSNGLGDIIKKNALARNELLAGWKEMGGRKALIRGLMNAWIALREVVKPVSKAFREIFPKQTAEGLVDLTKKFAQFTRGLIPSAKTMHQIKDIAGGVFSVFHIGIQIVKAIFGAFKELFGVLGGGNGDFLEFARGIGQNITQFDKFLEKSGFLTDFFNGLAHILAIPLGILKALGQIIGALFNGFRPDVVNEFGESVNAAGEKLSRLEGIAKGIINFIGKVADVFGKVGGAIADGLSNVGDVVAGAFTEETFGKTLDVINTGLLAGILLLIKNFFSKGVKIDLTGGLFDGIKSTLGEATGAFKNMQQNLKSDILLKIAISIGAMAAALLVLSTIEPDALKTALIAMATGMGLLITSMAAMMKVLGPVGIIQMYAVSGAITKLAFAMLILAAALKVMASMNFPEILRGIVGFALIMRTLTKAVAPLAANSKGLTKASFSIILLGVAMNILAVALKIFATMNWEEMGKGMAGLAGTLAILVAALKAMPPIQAEAVALVALGIAINLIAVALKIFATMSWEEMGKGAAALAGSLFIIAGALRLMPKGILLQAVALNFVATAILVLAGALKIMGKFKPGEIVKSLILLGGALLILAGGLKLMQSALPGAAALLVATAALAVLVPILIAMGGLEWETIIKSLTMLAGIFVILGLAGKFLAPFVLVVLGLGAAFLLIGAGLALAGAGALAFGTGFALIVATGTAGAQLMAQFLKTLIEAIPPALAAFGAGVVAFAVAIGKGAPKIVAAMGKILQNLLVMIVQNAPRVANAALAMIRAMLKVLVNAVPEIADAGLKLLLGLLKALDNNIDKIADTVTSLVVKFIRALGRNVPKMVDAGAKAMIDFLHGTADAIRNNDQEMIDAMEDIGRAMIEACITIIKNLAGNLKDAVVGSVKGALGGAKDFIGGLGSPLFRDEVGKPIAGGIKLGIDEGAPAVEKAVVALGKGALDTLKATMANLGSEMELDPDMNPTITPVLDLTKLTQDASRMSSILATSPISADVSYRTAANISADEQAKAELFANTPEPQPGETNYSYTQILQSPTPIDSAAAYRGGKTLFALKKEELT